MIVALVLTQSSVDGPTDEPVMPNILASRKVWLFWQNELSELAGAREYPTVKPVSGVTRVHLFPVNVIGNSCQ